MYVVTFAWVGRSEDCEVTETFNSFMELLKCLTDYINNVTCDSIYHVTSVSCGRFELDRVTLYDVLYGKKVTTF